MDDYKIVLEILQTVYWVLLVLKLAPEVFSAYKRWWMDAKRR